MKAIIRAALTLLFLGLANAAAAQTAAPEDRYAPGREILADIGRIVTPNGVQETFEVTLGNTRQVVNVRGADRFNPILLFIHGGPGATHMPIAWSWQRPWEDFFTIVQWDQRGAGRSFALEDTAKLAPTLIPDTYRDDAIALIELLGKRYGQRKVFVLGHSWGSVIGLSVAIKRPDLLHAYIGLGQVIDSRESERISFEWTLARARADNNQAAVRELEALRPYPGPGAYDLVKLPIQRKWNLHYGGFAAGRSDSDFYTRAPRLSPDYSLADRSARDDGSVYSLNLLWPQMSEVNFTQVGRLDVPIIELLGRHDYRTPASTTATWMKRLRAPKKTVVWFENSGHLAMIEEPGQTLAAMLKYVLPLARQKGSR